MSYEDEVRRQMEQAAAEQQVECPLPEDVDAAFGFRQNKKAAKKSGVSKDTAVVRGGLGHLAKRPKGAASKAKYSGLPSSRTAARETTAIDKVMRSIGEKKR